MESINALKAAILQFDELLEPQRPLNTLVIDKYSVQLPDNTERSDEYKTLMNQIMELARHVRIECGDKPESYLLELASIQNNDNEKFLNWLFDYMEETYKVYKDGLPFQKMDMKLFKEMLDYCFDNFILQVIDTAETAETWKAYLGDILKLRKITNVYIKLILWDNRSRQYTDNYMKNKLGLSQKHCDALYQKTEGNEEKLWRRFLVKRLNYIENCIDRLEQRINGLE